MMSDKNIYALVDCNNFYASCERVFKPDLEKKPVLVLSNNDGCIIARSNEVKALGIPMGAPFFQWEKFCVAHQVSVFSSNYELYGDMSERVMSTLRHLCPDLEIYSIDEAFLLFDGFTWKKNLTEFALHIKKIVKQWTGIPVSIGFAQTKTLAKIANKIAKKQTKIGVCDLSNPIVQEKILSQYPTEDIWGIGSRLSKRLANLNIHTAKDLRDSDPKTLRQQFSVVMERMILELRCVSCIPLESVQPKKQIMSSRSFGKLVTTLENLEEAISSYTARACIKLRAQNGFAQGIYVFLHTNIFREQDPQYGNSMCFYFPEACDDTGYMIHIAKICLRKIYRKGFRYHKAGVMLLDLIPNSCKQLNLFKQSNHQRQQLMKTIDKINQLMGKNSIFFCSEGIKNTWQIRRHFKSPCYTTRLKELLVAKVF